MARQKIHIHLGPHKTGSSAIQRALTRNADLLRSRFGLTPLETSMAAKVARHLNAGRIGKATEALVAIADACARAPGDCILSCEDLCGTLPGARKIRTVYPNLLRNLTLMRDSLGSVDCVFYFFRRPRDAWLHSTYAQNLKHRQRFNRFEDFAASLDTEELWQSVLAKPVEALGADFVVIDYPSDGKNTAMRSLLSAIGNFDPADVHQIVEVRANVAPDAADIRLMEKINRSSASKDAKRLGKLVLFSERATAPVPPKETAHHGWYRPPAQPPDLPQALVPLWQRVEKRVQTQAEPNLMPDTDTDLRPYRSHFVDGPDALPDVSRRRMADQVKLLSFRFRGLPQLCFLLGLTISYLRRETPHTDHAATLFQRLWAEEHRILLAILPTRWLISSFQTFLDHGANEDQRTIGAAAYFYANMLKAYETERALEGLEPDATYPSSTATTKKGFRGLDRFQLGGSDLILNTNVLLLELSARDPVAGRVVQEFLARARAAHTIFSRMDKSRQAHRIDNKSFANCWSFFEEP